MPVLVGANGSPTMLLRRQGLASLSSRPQASLLKAEIDQLSLLICHLHLTTPGMVESTKSIYIHPGNSQEPTSFDLPKSVPDASLTLPAPT